MALNEAQREKHLSGSNICKNSPSQKSEERKKGEMFTEASEINSAVLKLLNALSPARL